MAGRKLLPPPSSPPLCSCLLPVRQPDELHAPMRARDLRGRPASPGTPTNEWLAEVGRTPYPPLPFRPLVGARAQRERGTTEGTGRCGLGSRSPTAGVTGALLGPVRTDGDLLTAEEAEPRGSWAL